MNYLFGITIGPVQTYIEESRKLLDLQNSSKIISDIMKDILNKLGTESEKQETECKKYDKFELIYPCLKNADKSEDKDEKKNSIDCSNYAIGKLQNISSEQINELGKNIRDIVKNVLKRKNDVDLGEIIYPFWALVAIDTNYQDAYKKLSMQLRAMKNTYNFTQEEQTSGKKCILCGKYNVYDNSSNEKVELCKYCSLKRDYKTDYKTDTNSKIDSVYDIAISNWKYSNKGKQEFRALKGLLEDIFKNETSKGNIVEKSVEDRTAKYYSIHELERILQYLGSKNDKNSYSKLRSKYEKELLEDLNEDVKKDWEEKRKVDQIDKSRLKEKVEYALKLQKYLYRPNEKDKNLSIKEPIYEYCFIQMDVDNLGKWMSGSYIPSYLSADIELDEFQKNLSGLFFQFGMQMKQLFSEQNNGIKDMCKIIYSGGDDLLMVLPVEKIFTVLNIIEKNFEEKVRRAFKEYYSNIYENITYSVSITIAQCKNPMSYALQKTREELEYVKNRYKNNKKDGIAINYLINNGKELSCYLQRKNSKIFYDLIQQYLQYKDTIFFSYLNKFEQEFVDFKFSDITFEEYLSSKRILLIEFERFLEKSTKLIKAKQIETEEAVPESANEQNHYSIKEIMGYKKDLVNFVGDLLSENVFEERSNHESLDFSNVINILKMYQKLATRCEWEVES